EDPLDEEAVPAVGCDTVHALPDLERLIDCDWYRARYEVEETSRAGIWADYFGSGWRQGRDPCRWFNGRFYRRQFDDFVESGENPLLHYLAEGAVAGRAPSPRL